MNKPRSNEKGQILVIFVAVLVGLLGLTALSIDGGMIFSDRRFNQSASDAASLAGAGSAATSMDDQGVTYTNFVCNSTAVMNARNTAYNTARNRATSNNFTDLDNDVTDQHGIRVTCVNNPTQFEKHIDVQTMITSQVSTAFAHLFYSGPIRNSVNSVASIRPRTQLAFGYAIASLSQDCGSKRGGVEFEGSNSVLIHGGGVFSNSCLEGKGNISVAVDGAGINYVGDMVTSGHPSFSPAPEKYGEMPSMDVPVPACGAGTPVKSNDDGTISPGNYSEIKLTNGVLTMEPGLYCLSGDFDVTGGTVEANGVTIFMMKDGSKNTNFSINGNATAHLNAPTESNVTGGAKVGILVYMARGNEGSIGLQGNSGSSFLGTIFAPTGNIEIGGTSGVNPTYNTQLVGNFVKVHGNSKIEINYNASDPYTENPKLDLIH